MATQSDVAAHLDLSQAAVSQLVNEGVLPTPAGRGGLDLGASRIAYIRRLREQAAGRAPLGDGPVDLDLVRERARLAKGQADAQEMRNDVMRGLVVLVTDVAAIVGRQFSSIRTRLLAIPAERAMRIHQASTVPETQQLLHDAVHDVLTELSTPEAATRQASRGSRRAALQRLQQAAGEGADE